MFKVNFRLNGKLLWTFFDKKRSSNKLTRKLTKNTLIKKVVFKFSVKEGKEVGPWYTHILNNRSVRVGAVYGENSNIELSSYARRHSRIIRSFDNPLGRSQQDEPGDYSNCVNMKSCHAPPEYGDVVSERNEPGPKNDVRF